MTMTSHLAPEPSVLPGLPRPFKSRALLPGSARCLWRIETGFVRSLTWLENGSTVVLGLWGPGDLVGASPSAIDPYHVECLSRVTAIPMIQDSPGLHPELLLRCGQQAEALMLIRSYRRIDEMLLKLFDWLALRFGQPNDDGKLLDLRLTHQDLADLVGVTRVTITRTLMSLVVRQT